MRTHRTTWLGALFFAIAMALAGAQGIEPLVSLDASKQPEGPLAAWENAGTLKGSFKNDGTNPQVKMVDGVKAVDFTGKEYLVSDIKAPASITGDKPWTCIVRTYGRDIAGERSLVSWANRPTNCLEIEYGTAPLWGAIGTYSEFTSGWGNAVPEPKKWHTLVYTYLGGKDGEFQAWCDGKLLATKKFSLATKTDRRFVIGACMRNGDDPADKIEYMHHVDGAIASVKLFDRAMNTIEIWNLYGNKTAFLLEPKPGAQLEGTTTTLKWMAGTTGVGSFDVYLGSDPSEVEKAENSKPAGKPSDWKAVFKGNVPAATTEMQIPSMDVGQTYYWRVDQRDSAGKLAQRGPVISFVSPTGNASEPKPYNGYIVVEGGRHVLAWKPGRYAVKQNVYFAETAEALAALKKPTFPGLDTSVASVALPVQNPALGKPYFWRVESLNREPYSVSPGEVWSLRAVKRPVKVYLVGGQSNAVGCSSVKGIPENLLGEKKNTIIFVRGECRLGPYGWAYLKDGLGSGFGDRDGLGTIGPEFVFGTKMAPTNPEEVIAIIKCAWGGTNLGAQWRPPSAGGKTGELYTNFVKAVHEGLDAMDPAFQPEIAGMIWMQGESDTGDETMAKDYAKNLTCLIKDIRAEFKKPDMPFVIGQINKAPAWEGKNLGVVVRAGEEEVAKTVPHTAAFPTDDYGMCDPWHYDTPGMLSLGERFATAMKKSEGGK